MRQPSWSTSSRSSPFATSTSAWKISCRDESRSTRPRTRAYSSIVNDALEHGLARYEKRHPRAIGLIQGSVVVLHNRDGRILAEAGGRRVFNGRSASYSDYNRVTKSLRQPGSAMKPMVYLAAFRSGDFTLETLVPDEPISVPNEDESPAKWISNYDGRFKGMIPVRQALAESRNAVAMWITAQIGIDRVLRTSRSLGIRTPLQRYPTTALGASEINLLELANAYRTMASGIVAEPYLIRAVMRDSGEILTAPRRGPVPISIDRGSVPHNDDRWPGRVSVRLSTRILERGCSGVHSRTACFPATLYHRDTAHYREAACVRSGAFGLQLLTSVAEVDEDSGRDSSRPLEV